MQLHSVWNRRLVLGGSRKLNDDEEFKRRICISADETLEERRRATLERLKQRAAREEKEAVNRDDVLVIDNIAVFSVNDGFVKQSSAGRSGSSTSNSS